MAAFKTRGYRLCINSIVNNGTQWSLHTSCSSQPLISHRKPFLNLSNRFPSSSSTNFDRFINPLTAPSLTWSQVSALFFNFFCLNWFWPSTVRSIALSLGFLSHHPFVPLSLMPYSLFMTLGSRSSGGRGYGVVVGMDIHTHSHTTTMAMVGLGIVNFLWVWVLVLWIFFGFEYCEFSGFVVVHCDDNVFLVLLERFCCSLWIFWVFCCCSLWWQWIFSK